MEQWSEQLDGENGMIRQWRDHQSERRLTMTALKGAAWVLGPVTVYQLITAVFDLIHRTR
jgi:hypothetical protein